MVLQSTALKQARSPLRRQSGRLLNAEAEQLGSPSVRPFEAEGLIRLDAREPLPDGTSLVPWR